MNAEFFAAIEDIEKEKGIPRAYMYEKIQQAMLAAFRKDNPQYGENVEVILDEDKKRIELVVHKTVVEQVEDPTAEIDLYSARKLSKRAKEGDVLDIPVETKKFGRIAAQAAKQVIIQGIREAERGMVYEEFTSKEHELLTGEVSRIEPRTGAVSIRISSNSEYTEAMLNPSERIKTEVLNEGDRIKVYVVEVRKSTRGPQVMISRTHPGLVKRLFELEVPEIFDGTVEIKSIAREAGSRTKMAVWSEDPDVDPIGACVGPKGGRVASIVKELGGEKIDIVKYSEDPEIFVANALAPAQVMSVTLLDDKSCQVSVPDNQLSLAIGKEGQNARLAAKLTGFKIDIKSETALAAGGRAAADGGEALGEEDTYEAVSGLPGDEA
ncbi:MAG TPA: transcription termination/antitermination protein NusA [Candidatus Scatomorpha pullistercoris]|uniref:Transcription termination/antitermination protein NusA n=1 Tax=Candidatus Scatomorpha pullistercoris TaxID=2840929 RepID=A0A9D1G640_9FIRM|nr:transcription termination/antitermination protein NusA [Candidatus Scatomorpha pullistercoris]